VPRVEDALRVEIVHVPSHSRHRQKLVTVMTFASVSMILPLQNGQFVGRVTGSANFGSRMLVFPFLNASNAKECAGYASRSPNASHSATPVPMTAAAAIARFLTFLSCSTPRATQAAHRSSAVLKTALSETATSVCMTHAGGFPTLRLFKSEQPSRVAAPATR
jgi:hypothetical protein